MDKRLLIGVVLVGAAAAVAFFFWPKKASAEELAYVKQLTNEQLLGLMQAASAGLGYSNLSAEQTKQLAAAVEEELKARGVSSGSAATARPNLPQVSADLTQMGRPAVATGVTVGNVFKNRVAEMQAAMRQRQQPK